MDPDANLDELRTLVTRNLDAETVDPDDAARIVELFSALDAWITGTNGGRGFLPEDWQPTTK
ncbi:MAG: hypothetical protein ABWZ30_01085 [Jiangellaceae bacterium]